MKMFSDYTFCFYTLRIALQSVKFYTLLPGFQTLVTVENQ
jgi:hypothetical protein